MPDFGFVGASYEAPSIYQDAQECINFFCEIDPTKQPGTRGVVAMYPTPGLVKVAQLQYGEVRGMKTLSNENYIIAVSANKVYKIDKTWTATQIGTLVTSTGYVSISDNQTNEGMVAYIVDGVNRYTWVESTNSFATLPISDGPWRGALLRLRLLAQPPRSGSSRRAPISQNRTLASRPPDTIVRPSAENASVHT